MNESGRIDEPIIDAMLLSESSGLGARASPLPGPITHLFMVWTNPKVIGLCCLTRTALTRIDLSRLIAIAIPTRIAGSCKESWVMSPADRDV